MKAWCVIIFNHINFHAFSAGFNIFIFHTCAISLFAVFSLINRYSCWVIAFSLVKRRLDAMSRVSRRERSRRLNRSESLCRKKRRFLTMLKLWRAIVLRIKRMIFSQLYRSLPLITQRVFCVIARFSLNLTQLSDDNI